MIASFARKDDTLVIMRVHLSARIVPEPGSSAAKADSVLLTIRAVHWQTGHSEHRTTAPELLSLLRRRTDVNALTLERFGEQLRRQQDARLFHIEMGDDLLERVGFFVE